MKPMQSMFRSSARDKGVPSLNMASMPDLIFTVLFFFMIVTHMRSDEVKVRLQVPQGTEVQKLANRPSVVNVYVGQLDGQWQVQVNGDVVRPDDITARIEQIRQRMAPENAEHLTVSFRADRKAPMRVINQVKRTLQRSYALRINYSATEIKQK
jgi:biopolymer transport protein ExbD